MYRDLKKEKKEEENKYVYYQIKGNTQKNK